MKPVPELVAVVAEQSRRPCAPALQNVASAVAERFGESLEAVLFYGSCLRDGDPAEGIIDVYALVDKYSHAYRERYLRVFNAVLVPNVFYMECRCGPTVLRIKCTVLSLRAFERGTDRWFHSYLWARFAQPVRLISARSRAVEARIHSALAVSVVNLLQRAVPCLTAPFDARTLWADALARSYACELRTESRQRASELVSTDLDDYRARTHAAADALGLTAAEQQDYYRPRTSPTAELRRRTKAAWWLRRWQGRVISVLRLMKNSMTFRGGVDYVAWKIERHTGLHVDVTPRLRRFPLIFGWPVLWRLLLQGTIR